MKYSIAVATWVPEMAPVLYRGELNSLADKSKLAGYDAIEIHLKDPKTIDGIELKSYCEKVGIEISAIASGLSKVIDNLDYIDDDITIRKRAVQRTLEYIDLAEQLGSGVIVGSLRGSIPDLKNRRLYDNRFKNCMNQVLEGAEKKNVDIYLEAINRYENNYLNTAEETLQYIKPFMSKHLYVHLDTFHMNIEERDMVEAIKLCNDKLGYFHLADNNRKYVGAGAIDFKKVINALEEVGYTGYLSLECLPLPDADTAARKSMEALNNI